MNHQAELAALQAQLQIALTQLKATETALQVSQDSYRALVEEQNDLLSHWAPDRTLLYVNSAYCRFYGTSSEDLLGKDLLAVVHESIRDKLCLALERVTHSLSPAYPLVASEEWSMDAQGQEHYYLWRNRGIFDDEGHLLEIQSLGHDITERKRAEDDLRASEAHNRALLSALPDLVMRIDREGTYLDFLANANTNFKIMGKTGDFIGTTVYENLPPELAQRRIEAIQAALATGSMQFYEQDFEIEGQIQTEEVRVVPYNGQEALLLLRDISDRKQAEKALQESEARFQRLAALSPGIIYTSLQYPDNSIQRVYLSPAFEEIHEISIAEALQNQNRVP
jgi:PAS domain S-box-containing protein